MQESSPPNLALPTPPPGPTGRLYFPPPPKPDRVDLTGQWVSIVTEDWRWRMVTPPKGDVSSVPVNPHGLEVTNAWDPDRDEAAGEQCRAYGAAGLMRMPTRLRITAIGGSALRIETDAGEQVRIFHFDGKPPPADLPHSWQGYSLATWPTLLPAGSPPGSSPTGPTGPVTVVTTHLRAGYLRRNGVPYSDNAQMTEYLDRVEDSDLASWLLVVTIIDDPEYLSAPFVTSTHFRKEVDTSKWNPRPCEILRSH